MKVAVVEEQGSKAAQAAGGEVRTPTPSTASTALPPVRGASKSKSNSNSNSNSNSKNDSVAVTVSGGLNGHESVPLLHKGASATAPAPWAAKLWITVAALLFVGSLGAMLTVQHKSVMPNIHLSTIAVFASLGMFLLFGWMFGVNVYVWERFKVDHALAFAWQGATLRYYQVFLLATVPTVALALGVTILLVSVHATGQQSTLFPFSTIILSVGTIFFLFACIPLPGIYSASRMYIGRTIREVLIGPLCYSVPFVHNYLADVMTSTCLALAELEAAACVVFSGVWLGTAADPHPSHCGAGSLNNDIGRPIMYALPFWLRFVQCSYLVWKTRRQRREMIKNLLNAIKYLSCLNVVITSTLHGRIDGVAGAYDWSIWRFMWLGAIVIKTAYCYVWDVTMDWGLGKLRPGMRYPLLRPRIMYKSCPIWYYFAMFSNFLMRAAWAVAISPRQCPPNWRMGLACVEILRRAQWSIFRVENQFLSKVPRLKGVDAKGALVGADGKHRSRRRKQRHATSHNRSASASLNGGQRHNSAPATKPVPVVGSSSAIAAASAHRFAYTPPDVSVR